MTGPEHYREAEQLLEQSNDSTTYDEAVGLIAQAQVHATLALAAATAEQTAAANGGQPDRIGRPFAEDPDAGDPAYPGTPWGRAFYGEVAS